MSRLSARGQVAPFHVMEVLKAAGRRERTHGDVIRLCVGQPSTPAPAAVRDAAVQTLQRDVLGYTDAVGTPALRAAIAAHYGHEYDLDVDPDQVVVTTGSSGGFTALFLAAFDVGDVVAMARPGYPAYRNSLAALGCDVAELDCGPAQRYQPTVEQLDDLVAEGRTPAGLILASPANPTGTLVEDDRLADLARWCEEHGTLLISDEIYHGVTYDRPATCARTFSREGAVVGSFSKYFSMTGWRLGWLVLPEQYVTPVDLLLGNLNLCAPAPAQAAAPVAFSPEARAECESHVQRYAANRDLLLRRLPELGITSFAPPDGAFYAYCDVAHLTDDSASWCADVLDATGVAITPGIDFAPVDPARTTPLDGNRFVRLSFAGGTDEIDEALDRLVRFCAAGSPGK
ncbi:MAG: aminotransferase class I/II-fold pyridoxal phosphate-dependent enzyme [Mobilicoccus sp.]|nr:aminotransferase class I/II-fold pyridoxal phosphate-dependent enzyme [Mobilicoccus sp.]